MKLIEATGECELCMPKVARDPKHRDVVCGHRVFSRRCASRFRNSRLAGDIQSSAHRRPVDSRTLEDPVDGTWLVRGPERP